MLLKKFLLAGLVFLLTALSNAYAQTATYSQVLNFGCALSSNTTLFLRNTDDKSGSCYGTDDFATSTATLAQLPFDGTLSNLRCSSQGLAFTSGATLTFSPRINMTNRNPSLLLTGNGVSGGDGISFVSDTAGTKVPVSAFSWMAIKVVSANTSGTVRVECSILYTYTVPQFP